MAFTLCLIVGLRQHRQAGCRAASIFWKSATMAVVPAWTVEFDRRNFFDIATI
jgi:hypothetical protein